jgi:hypothetical protein
MNATDQIDYARPFTERVKGTLYARFRLDSTGAPQFEVWQGERLYTLDLYLVSPYAGAIDEVRYTLDDPSEPNPLGTSTDRANDFRVAFETIGDEPLRVFVRMGGETYEQRVWLSQMLANGHAKALTPEIRSALIEIRVN